MTPPLDLDALEALTRETYDKVMASGEPVHAALMLAECTVVLALIARVRKAEHEANQYNELLAETAEKLDAAEARLAEAVLPLTPDEARNAWITALLDRPRSESVAELRQAIIDIFDIVNQTPEEDLVRAMLNGTENKDEVRKTRA